MAIIKWDPFDTEKWFDEEFGLNLKELKLGWDLAVDVYEEKGNVIAEMNVPGIDPEKIEISIEDDYLKVCGKREEKKEKKEKDYYHKEIRKGSFSRMIHLPHAVEAKGTTAECKGGVLKVIMPKKKITKEGKVKIKVKK